MLPQTETQDKFLVGANILQLPSLKPPSVFLQLPSSRSPLISPLNTCRAAHRRHYGRDLLDLGLMGQGSMVINDSMAPTQVTAGTGPQKFDGVWVDRCFSDFPEKLGMFGRVPRDIYHHIPPVWGYTMAV